jgi:regulator of cell morphogenesis and NO signaling
MTGRRAHAARTTTRPEEPPMTDAGTTLAEVVANDMSRSGVLDRLGLDYCCGGGDTIEHACARSGLDTASVLALLDAAPELPDEHDCTNLTITELVAHLVDVHHGYLHAELPELDRLAERVVQVHAERHAELREVRELVTAVRADLEPHLMKEERVLFPAIAQLDAGRAPEFPFGSIKNPVTMMRAEHDRTGELLARLRTVTDGYAVPDDACASYRALYERLAHLERDTHLHVFEENHLLFPRVVALEP